MTLSSVCPGLISIYLQVASCCCLRISHRKVRQVQSAIAALRRLCIPRQPILWVIFDYSMHARISHWLRSVVHYAKGSLIPVLIRRIIFNDIPQRSPSVIRPLANLIFGQLDNQLVRPKMKKHLGFVRIPYPYSSLTHGLTGYMTLLSRSNRICPRPNQGSSPRLISSRPQIIWCYSPSKPHFPRTRRHLGPSRKSMSRRCRPGKLNKLWFPYEYNQ